MQTTKKQKSGWKVTVPMAAAAVAYLVFVFLPGVKQYKAKRDELAGKRDHITQGGDHLVNIQQMSEELERAGMYAASWEKRLPKGQGLADLYGRINGQSQAVGAAISRFEPGETRAYDSIRQVPVVLATKTSYGQAAQLLARLEGLDAPIWVEGLRLGAIEAGKSAECELSLVVFAGTDKNSD